MPKELNKSFLDEIFNKIPSEVQLESNILNLLEQISKELNSVGSKKFFKFPELRVVKDGEIDPKNSYSSRIDFENEFLLEINGIKVESLFRTGSTIIFQSAQNYLNSINYLNTRFRAFLNEKFYADVHSNIYVTPSNSKGFSKHFDTHDVFIIQVKGKKSWKIWTNPIQLPNKNHRDKAYQKFALECAKDSQPIIELNLNPNECLYIPAGFLHEATNANKEESIHITLSIKITSAITRTNDLIQSYFLKKQTQTLMSKSISSSNILNSILNNLKVIGKRDPLTTHYYFNEEFEENEMTPIVRKISQLAPKFIKEHEEIKMRKVSPIHYEISRYGKFKAIKDKLLSDSTNANNWVSINDLINNQAVLKLKSLELLIPIYRELYHKILWDFSVPCCIDYFFCNEGRFSIELDSDFIVYPLTSKLLCKNKKENKNFTPLAEPLLISSKSSIEFSSKKPFEVIIISINRLFKDELPILIGNYFQEIMFHDIENRHAISKSKKKYYPPIESKRDFTNLREIAFHKWMIPTNNVSMFRNKKVSLVLARFVHNSIGRFILEKNKILSLCYLKFSNEEFYLPQDYFETLVYIKNANNFSFEDVVEKSSSGVATEIITFLMNKNIVRMRE